MRYRVITVSRTKELNDFIELPFQIYESDRNWVAPIRSEIRRTLNKNKNPYFRSASLVLFNCYCGSEIVTRVSLVVNRIYCDKFSQKTAFFGFFESFKDIDAAKVLFRHVDDYCMENEIERLEGPFNPSHYSELGMLSNRYLSPPSFFQTYNPDYYHNLMLASGFFVAEIFHTRKNDNNKEYLNSNFKTTLQFEDGFLKVRSLNINDLGNDLEYLRNIFNDAFSENWHFTPVTKDEYLFTAKHLKLVTPPELIQFVEYQGTPVAAIQFALNINPLLRKLNGKIGLVKYLKFLVEIKKVRNALIFAAGIKKEYQNSKVSKLLFNIAVETGRKFNCLETTWMYDENKSSISLAEKLGLNRDKEFLIYAKNYDD